ncbi:MAG: hypothetical protein BAJALOKI3v1_120077 [Promethearchaeota archaeon]|nr:MAG: hypothetical protein BAJALOKI3v1_120077 [Candidatus Lokiarchaeota archaeon]
MLEIQKHIKKLSTNYEKQADCINWISFIVWVSFFHSFNTSQSNYL